MSWCTIESDPGVFTELLSTIGVRGVQVEEIYELDDVASFGEVYGLIFLFKWREEKDDRPTEEAPNVFFAKQVISNACATQAILSVVINRPEIDPGDELRSFKEFTFALPPDIRGLAIGNSEIIRTAHNSFSRPEPFVFEKEKAATEDDDVYHFVGYVPVDGAVYELDGLKPGPILIGQVSGSSWLDIVRPAIQQRMAKYSASETAFNLLAIVPSRIQQYEDTLKRLTQRRAQLNSTVHDERNTAELEEISGRIRQTEEALAEEQQKRHNWKVENVRRRHNYIPFIFNLLKALAEHDKLNGLVEEGAKVTAKKLEKKREREREKKAKAGAPPGGASGQGGKGGAAQAASQPDAK